MTEEDKIPGAPGKISGDIPVVRELRVSDFPRANIVWQDYHEITGDPARDRIFGTFLSGDLVSVVRCRRHHDGIEIDGVFTSVIFRKRGYSRMVVEAAVEACHNDDLYMYAVLHLEPFYRKFGFIPVPEYALPPAIRERYTWATGNLEGADVIPMHRPASILWKNPVKITPF